MQRLLGVQGRWGVRKKKWRPRSRGFQSFIRWFVGSKGIIDFPVNGDVGGGRLSAATWRSLSLYGIPSHLANTNMRYQCSFATNTIGNICNQLTWTVSKYHFLRKLAYRHVNNKYKRKPRKSLGYVSFKGVSLKYYLSYKLSVIGYICVCVDCYLNECFMTYMKIQYSTYDVVMKEMKHTRILISINVLCFHYYS